MVSTRELISFCSTTLDAERFRDAAVNGLQVEGKQAVHRLATSVSVSERTIRAAIGWNADMLLVHHGLLWGERTGPIMGPLRTRLRLMLEAEMNLVAYHLPLDAHATIGNNARLIQELGLRVERPFAEISGQPIGFIASSEPMIALEDLAHRIERLTSRAPTVLPGGSGKIERIAVVSGSGYSTPEEVAALDCQALVTGDVREPTMALARELGVTVLAGGHEATERLGVQALADLLKQRFQIETRFFSDPNPI